MLRIWAKITKSAYLNLDELPPHLVEVELEDKDIEKIIKLIHKPTGNITMENKTEEKKPEQPAEAPAKPPVIPGEEDIDERVNGFNKELVSLLAKYELGIGANAMITTDGRVGASPTILSARKKADKPGAPVIPGEEGKTTPPPSPTTSPTEEKKGEGGNIN